jgi:hypothetical protein
VDLTYARSNEPVRALASASRLSSTDGVTLRPVPAFSYAVVNVDVGVSRAYAFGSAPTYVRSNQRVSWSRVLEAFFEQPFHNIS